MIQSAFLLGYMATQLWGGSLADKHGGKVVLALGIAWYSAASILTPVALSAPVQAIGLALPALLLARTCVVCWTVKSVVLIQYTSIGEQVVVVLFPVFELSTVFKGLMRKN